MGKAPEDATVSYFPAVVIGVNSYKDSAQILIQANAPSSNTSNGGRAYRMRASHDGNIYYSADDGSWAERIGTGLPVRCVKE